MQPASAGDRCRGAGESVDSSASSRFELAPLGSPADPARPPPLGLRVLLRPLVQARDPWTRRAVGEIHEGLTGLPRGSHVDDGRLLDELEVAARRGSLVVRPVVRPAVVLPIEDAVEEPVVGPDAPHAAWIEIVLVDDRGKAVPGVEYRIECDGGRARSGTTGRDGRAREDGLPGGSCKVSFPRLHGTDWQRTG